MARLAKLSTESVFYKFERDTDYFVISDLFIGRKKGFPTKERLFALFIGLEYPWIFAAKTGEARLAGQAAIEGLSAPMRLPSAISHTPKLSECFILYFNL